MNIWVILIIVFVILIFVTVGIVLLVFFLKKKNKNDLPKDPDEDPVGNPEDDEQPIPPAIKCPPFYDLICVIQTANNVQYPTYPISIELLICPVEKTYITISDSDVAKSLSSIPLIPVNSPNQSIGWSYLSGSLIFYDTPYNASNDNPDKITCYPKIIQNTWLFDGYQIWDSATLKVMYLNGNTVGLRDSSVEYGIVPIVTSGLILFGSA